MVKLWIGRQGSNLDVLQDACESISVLHPECIMTAERYKVVYGKCRRKLTLCIQTTEEAVARVHDGLVAAGLVYVETDDGLISIKAWSPQRANLKLSTSNLSRSGWQGPRVYPTNADLAARRRRLEKLDRAYAASRKVYRSPQDRHDRSKSLRELS